jgi:phosphotriesterase-related protein
VIRAGIIGEIGCSWPLHENERKVLRAAAQAQQPTGASISVHPGRNKKAPFEIIEILSEAGADLKRVIMCHTDARLRDHSERCELLKTGCVIEYDLWGWEGHFPSYWTAEDFMDLPNDTQRIYEVRQLIDEGYINQIVISHDICCKSRRACYGGWGYAHILNYIVPMMLQRNVTREQIDNIMVENPKRLLCFV